jgi:hypothetical protein
MDNSLQLHKGNLVHYFITSHYDLIIKRQKRKMTGNNMNIHGHFLHMENGDNNYLNCRNTARKFKTSLLEVLGFHFRASCLLAKHSIT